MRFLAIYSEISPDPSIEMSCTYRVAIKVEDVSTYKSEFISITSPIDIRKGMKKEGIVVIKSQTMIRCATKILKKTLDSSQMITSKAMHKL